MIYSDFKRIMCDVNTKEKSGKMQHINGYIIVDNNSFDIDYPLDQRTYIVSSDNKAFNSNAIGYSIFARDIAKIDYCRLEAYLKGERGNWEVEDCYFTNSKGKKITDAAEARKYFCLD